MYIIISDVDGTMIDNNLILMETTAKDIREAKAKGIMFAICTGNSHFENMQALSLKIDADFLISSDGARLYDVKANKIIYKSLIDKEQASKFLNAITKINGGAFLTWVSEKDFSINILDDKYYNSAFSINKKFHKKSGDFVFTNKINADIYKMSISGKKEFIDMIVELVKKHDLNFLRVHDLFITVSNKHNNKGQAVKELINFKNIDINNAMTIGDGENDISMLSILENSYAMADASAIVKTTAKKNTSSVEQNGLGEAIIDFIFRKKI